MATNEEILTLMEDNSTAKASSSSVYFDEDVKLILPKILQHPDYELVKNRSVYINALIRRDYKRLFNTEKNED